MRKYQILEKRPHETSTNFNIKCERISKDKKKVANPTEKKKTSDYHKDKSTESKTESLAVKKPKK